MSLLFLQSAADSVRTTIPARVDTVTKLVHDTVLVIDRSGPQITDWLTFVVTTLLALLAVGTFIYEHHVRRQAAEGQQKATDTILGIRALAIKRTIMEWMDALATIDLDRQQVRLGVRNWLGSVEGALTATERSFEDLAAMRPQASQSMGKLVALAYYRFHLFTLTREELLEAAETTPIDYEEVSGVIKRIEKNLDAINRALTTITAIPEVPRADGVATPSDTPGKPN